MSFILRATKCLLVIHMLAYTFSMYKSAALAGMVDVHMSSIRRLVRLVKHQTFRWALWNFCNIECKVVTKENAYTGVIIPSKNILQSYIY